MSRKLPHRQPPANAAYCRKPLQGFHPGGPEMIPGKVGKTNGITQRRKGAESQEIIDEFANVVTPAKAGVQRRCNELKPNDLAALALRAALWAFNAQRAFVRLSPE